MELTGLGIGKRGAGFSAGVVEKTLGAFWSSDLNGANGDDIAWKGLGTAAFGAPKGFEGGMLPENGEVKLFGGSDGWAGVCSKEGAGGCEVDDSSLGSREDSSTSLRRLEAESDGPPNGTLSERCPFVRGLDGCSSFSSSLTKRESSSALALDLGGRARARFDSIEVSIIPKFVASEMFNPSTTATKVRPARFDSTIFSEKAWSDDGWKAVETRVSREMNNTRTR